MLNEEQKQTLLTLARETMKAYIVEGNFHRFETHDKSLTDKAGAFVTLHNHGALRGCIGMIEGKEPLYQTVIEMAIQASRNDPRFEPINEQELEDIDIEISVLFPKRKVESIDDIEFGKHGVIIKKGFVSGVFLPQVFGESGWSETEFMEHLCVDKAGLPKDAYLDKNTEIYVFDAEVFDEGELRAQ